MYNHDQLLHLSPTGMLSPLSCHLAGNRHILTTAAVSIIALIFLLFFPKCLDSAAQLILQALSYPTPPHPGGSASPNRFPESQRITKLFVLEGT